MKNTQSDHPYKRFNEQEDEVTFRTVDDILDYYSSRQGTNPNPSEKPLN
ncbi:hypothetical protein [Paenibacillus sp. DMB20]|nr:hypothetical protein [Paenibacillus sp. DMB20]